MSELLSCPFCGGEAELCIHEATGVSWVRCIECEASGGATSAKQAIEAWNTRAERTCEREERGWGTEGDHARVWLTCGHDCMVPTVPDLPNYCPNCGAKVLP